MGHVANRRRVFETLAVAACVAACEPSEPALPACIGALLAHGTTLQSDREHCGACGQVCARDDACIDGQCAADRSWALWPIPELPLADDHYDIRADVVRDRITGLEWQRAVPAERIAYDQADEHCQSLELAGGGWRLPTRIELVSIVDFTRAMPAINTAAFHDTPSEPFKYAAWATSAGNAPDSPTYQIDFTKGEDVVYRDDEAASVLTHYVRCVRDVAAPKPMGEHYAIGADTTLDRQTHLRWVRAASAPCTECSLSGAIGSLPAAERYCDGLSADGYDDFRVPALVELLSIFNAHADAVGYIRVDEDAFPAERQQWDSSFFSSTTSVDTRLWVADFRTGQASDSAGARRVRCVRTEEAL
jgi:hypothetical protein